MQKKDWSFFLSSFLCSFFCLSSSCFILRLSAPDVQTKDHSQICSWISGVQYMDCSSTGFTILAQRLEVGVGWVGLLALGLYHFTSEHCSSGPVCVLDSQRRVPFSSSTGSHVCLYVCLCICLSVCLLVDLSLCLCDAVLAVPYKVLQEALRCVSSPAHHPLTLTIYGYFFRISISDQ